ncbi:MULTISPECIES: 3-hydroxybutyryl-CoA dehydrogenase [Acetoanaerobium]|uniref:3-hydroxybutyryl-CoA dehydrogenase n=1 Tax=Acetoanaerobium sticklandii (strain ATCC 12662 / DSM 519 / JCM 1433 / CCUG 9281 / NCIMB 10654 / HF) TaxID=499177 RepID=E3PXT8_ACESD|nr:MULTISPECIES: 3-hydroxybutyryl-CoA dehydrogenase [Acetoanaerobium]MBP8762395.1 3-hydroxybutyryl-CoA dehydrogenase [Acetoanaerobium sp.]MBP9499618.1 3-hydroxybutyryl-CoA dehydrogenase [Acetoanaerobium sp.]MBP9562665.1 3-hydroxybutyryl-CoA dehydrogenase [Acetoanaerobium sp.]CBH21253.1 3-hydroxybutyryl-CoA dehydrogenase [Acetoanaerobium sticklandii]
MKICVIGSGTMGNGIVQTFATKGHKVVIKGHRQESLDKAIASLDKGLSKLVEKGKITSEDKDITMSNISTTLSYEDIKDADLVIEAIVEDIKVKETVFKELDEICEDKTILATNTSSLSITEIASFTKRPEKVIGMHFFNPVPVMKLTEIITGQKTSVETFDTVFKIASDIGKVPVRVEESPGFVVNRILVPMINEAVGILSENVASKEDIDESMKLGANHPIGPLALADLIGLDVCLAIMEVLYNEFSDSKYRPHPLLKKMVRANNLGRKTGKGFYEY